MATHTTQGHETPGSTAGNFSQQPPVIDGGPHQVTDYDPQSRPSSNRKRNALIGIGSLVAAGAIGWGANTLSSSSDNEADRGPEPAPPAATAPVEVEPANPAEPAEVEPTEPTIDFTVTSERASFLLNGGETSEVTSFYSGLDHQWILGSAPEAGRNYVENFLLEKGITTPLALHADRLHPTDNSWLVDLETGPGDYDISEIAGGNIATVLNVYLANKDELNLSLDQDQPETQRVFDAMGTYLIRGMAETGADRTLCEDEFDCPSAIDHAGFRQLIQAADDLPAGSVIVGARINAFPDERNRHDDVTFQYIDGTTGEAVISEVTVDNNFEIFPLEVPLTTDSMANAINLNYLGAPNGHGDTGLIFMENDAAINDKIGNRPLN